MDAGRLLRLGVVAGWAALLAGCALEEARPLTELRPARPEEEFSGSAAGAYLAGREAQGRHDLESAAFYLARALALDPDNVEILHRAAVALALQGRVKDAAALAIRLEAFDEESTVPVMLLAEQRAKQDDWAGLSALLAPLPERGLYSYLLPLNRAWAKMGEGDVDAALQALKALDHVQGLSVLRDFNQALITDLAERPQEAEKAYRATLAAPAGRSLRTVSLFAGFLHRHGREAEASQLVTAFRHDHPDLPDLEFSDRRLVASPAEGMAEGFFGAALTLRQAGAVDLALFFSQLALDLRPDFPLAKVMLGDILSGLSQWEAANLYYRQLPPGSPLYRGVRLRVAHNLEEQGRVDEAAAQLESLAQEAPAQADAPLALGDLFRRQRRWLEAVQGYDRAVAILEKEGRDEWALYYARGIALERANLWPRAEADLLHALELQPDEPQVLNYLGYSWVEQGVNLPRATQMIEKAVSQRPEDGFIIDSLGWAFYRSGDFPRAVETLQKAVALEPGDAAINDHLGDALWSAGRREEARFQWQHALLFDPDPELKAQLAKKLQQAAGPVQDEQ